MLYVIWQIYKVINIDGSLACGVKICSATYFFSALFKKYVTGVVVLKIVCTLVSLCKCQPDAEFHCHSFLLLLFVSVDYWCLKHLLSLPNMPFPDRR